MVLAQDVIIFETEAEIRLSSSITVVYRHAQNKLIISSKDLKKEHCLSSKKVVSQNQFVLLLHTS